jgi:hypothetical protein
MINVQLMNDIGQYPLTWVDDEPFRAPTMGELDDIVDGVYTSWTNPIEAPIGRIPDGHATQVSFWVAPTKS